MKGLWPDVSRSVDPDGESDTQGKKSLNEDFTIESSIKEPEATTVQEIGKLSHKINGSSWHADKGAGSVRKNQWQKRKSFSGTEPCDYSGPQKLDNEISLTYLSLGGAEKKENLVMGIKKNHTNEYKAKVVVAALKEGFNHLSLLHQQQSRTW